MELQKEKILLNNIHPMVRVLLPNVSFMQRLFMSLRFRMNEKNYHYRKVESLASNSKSRNGDLLMNATGNVFAGLCTVYVFDSGCTNLSD